MRNPTTARRRRLCVGAVLAGALSLPALAHPAYGTPATGPYTPPGSAALATPQPPSPNPTPTPPAGDTFATLDRSVTGQLDGAVQHVMRQAHVPGVIAALSAPGKGEYIRSFGVADKQSGRSMTPGLNMRIGSETKTFTVTALLELVDRGKVGLDDPIGKYVDGVPNGDRITLRRLADMRSGLFNYTADNAFFKAFTTDPRRPFTPQELLSYSFRHPVNFQPGQKFEYSNTNAVLLGLVVEKAGGMPLNEFLAKNVIGRAGLRHTFLPTDAAFPQPHARGYTDQTASGRVEDATDWNPSWAWAAGAMISDLPDLRTWARVVATGTLLSTHTQAERLKTPPSGIPGTGYGLGIFNVQGWIGHNGSLPGYESLTLYLPEHQATLVVLLNTDIQVNQTEPSTLFGQAITRIVTPRHVYNLPEPTAPRATPPPASSPSPGAPGS
ncbi:serine hydrolase domain-containing protein [Streptomyces sp. NPDC048718]|uniref:serine hydrolase domain-containing protein n=1 Tax=Streptomyces sp. NPDC048718 TaxID=3365587 RepID=UPI0037128709